MNIIKEFLGFMGVLTFIWVFVTTLTIIYEIMAGVG